MNHAHLALGFTLLATATLAAIGCTSRQDLGCVRSETCPDGIGGGGGSGPTLPTGMRSFITNAKFDGNLQAAGAQKTGIDSANALCQAAADGATLGGHWAAWLSDTTSDAIDRVADDGPWSLVKTNDMVYANRAAVGAPTTTTITDEHGAIVEDTIFGNDEFGHLVSASYSAEFWTGSIASGRSSGQDCSRWRSTTTYPATGGRRRCTVACSTWSWAVTSRIISCAWSRRWRPRR
jgi:hypothetical protein